MPVVPVEYRDVLGRARRWGQEKKWNNGILEKWSHGSIIFLRKII
jgi:hypothetical protein